MKPPRDLLELRQARSLRSHSRGVSLACPSLSLAACGATPQAGAPPPAPSQRAFAPRWCGLPAKAMRLQGAQPAPVARKRLRPQPAPVAGLHRSAGVLKDDRPASRPALHGLNVPLSWGKPHTPPPMAAPSCLALQGPSRAFHTPEVTP